MAKGDEVCGEQCITRHGDGRHLHPKHKVLASLAQKGFPWLATRKRTKSINQDLHLPKRRKGGQKEEDVAAADGKDDDDDGDENGEELSDTEADSDMEVEPEDTEVLDMCSEVFVHQLLQKRGYDESGRPTVRMNASGSASSSSGEGQRLQFVKPTDEQVRGYDMIITQAVRQGNADEVRRLIDAGRRMDVCNRFGENLVHLACRRGDIEIFHLLMANGARVDVCDDLGRVPLHDLAWCSNINMTLFEEVMDINPLTLFVKDCHGNSPLRFVRKEQWSSVNAFIQERADVYWPERVARSKSC